MGHAQVVVRVRNAIRTHVKKKQHSTFVDIACDAFVKSYTREAFEFI